MVDSPMPTVLFISVFVLIFFKFCLGAPQLASLGELGEARGPLHGALGALALEVAAGRHEDEGVDQHASNMAVAAEERSPLTSSRKCPVGTVYSVAVAGCKDLVRSADNASQRLQLLMPFLLAATQQQQPQQRQ